MAAQLALSVVSGLTTAQARYKAFDCVGKGLAMASVTNTLSSAFLKRGLGLGTASHLQTGPATTTYANTKLSDSLGRGLGIAPTTNTIFSGFFGRGFATASHTNTAFSGSSGRGLGIAPTTNTIFSGFFKRGFSTSSPIVDRTHVDWTIKEGVAVVEMNEPNSPGNSWTTQMQAEIMEVMDEIWTDDRVHSAAVVSRKPDSFLIGVDANRIKHCKTEAEATLLSQDWQKMMDRIENSPKPIVAAINGWCFNGGLEFAMACQYRVATRNTATIFGSREIRMGLMPSAGGTVRLTKLVGPCTALDLMLEGYAVKADAAKKMGLVHKVIDPLDHDYLKDVAVDCARDIVNKKISLTPQWNNFLVKAYNYYYSYPTARQALYKKVRERVAVKETFFAAPIKIIDTVKTAVELGPAAGYQAEAQNFGHLAVQSEATALIRMHQDLITFYMRRVMEDMGF